MWKMHLQIRFPEARRRSGRLGILALATGLCVGACAEETSTPVASPPLMETGADAVLTGLTHTITVNGVKQGDLVADTAFSFQDSTFYRLVNPRLVLFTETGVQRARVNALRGRYNPTTKEMLATGEVVLIITDGNRRVESEELNYSPNGDRIWSDSFTVMHEPGRILEGVGFDSDLSFQNATVGPGSIRNTGEPPDTAPADTAAPAAGSGGPVPDTLSRGDDPEAPMVRPTRRPGGGGGSSD